ncbi:MFS transporter (plasmid) [Paraburkholderia sp. D15]|uniref:MFS transporter n=1 Tax=Paraburkholderia sp. D15 TaxID=2880218 RepID=UPI002478406D|nr:MFS transporter [Paraburkholderia sp. D15]WGS55274.1 MFS transporter [Paraburkholderia sp. D15]
MIEARINRLPMTRHLWSLVFLLGLGAFFEAYDLSLTSVITPGLVRSGIFQARGGLIGLPDQAAFGMATFLGLFAGALLFGRYVDRFGRKSAFNGALLLYTGATVAMALQHSAVWIDVWRFMSAVGLGVELVAIDVYIAEIVPIRYRGRAFAFAFFVQFLAVPVAGALGVALVPRSPLGFDGWRWVAVLGSVGAALVWIVRTRLPESPAWLAQHGRYADAVQIVAGLEKRCFGEVAASRLPPLELALRSSGEAAPPSRVGLGAVLRAPWLRLVTMLTVINVFMLVGFYGFGNWVPTLLAAQGHSVVTSLTYAAYISLIYPLSPLLFLFFADRFERKYQIAAAALGAGICGLLFGHQSSPVLLIAFGAGTTVFNVLNGYATFTYQAELFPPAIRAQAIGFAYSWGRLATAFSSLIIGFLLQRGGSGGVFVFLAMCQIIVAAVVLTMGPRTLDLRRKRKDGHLSLQRQDFTDITS